jgi:hypothetical protein
MRSVAVSGIDSTPDAEAEVSDLVRFQMWECIMYMFEPYLHVAA